MPMPMRTMAASTSQTHPGMPPLAAPAAARLLVAGTSDWSGTVVVSALVTSALPVFGTPGVTAALPALGVLRATRAEPPELRLTTGAVPPVDAVLPVPLVPVLVVTTEPVPPVVATEGCVGTIAKVGMIAWPEGGPPAMEPLPVPPALPGAVGEEPTIWPLPEEDDELLELEELELDEPLEVVVEVLPELVEVLVVELAAATVKRRLADEVPVWSIAWTEKR